MLEQIRIHYCFTCEKPLESLTVFMEHGRAMGHRVQEFTLKRRHRRPGEVQWSTDWEPER